MLNLTKRDFLKLSAAGGAGALLAGCGTVRGPMSVAVPMIAPITKSPSDIVRIGMIGVGGKGSSMVGEVLKEKHARITAVCDVDSSNADKVRVNLEKKGLKDVFTCQDPRKVLERDDVDAVIISTPNHWHALLAIWGVQAGKHVYVEKPVSFNIFESQQLIAAARKYGRIIEGGTQNRSDVGLRPGFAKLRAGALGKVKRVTGIVYRYRQSIGRADGPCEIPSGVDFDLWCGPAPKVVPRRKKFHYDWHYFWDQGGGDISNQGPHELDLVRWALGNPEAPRRVITIGGRFLWNDDGQAPNQAMVVYDYPGVEVVFDVRNLAMKPGVDESPQFKNLRTGVYVECENGIFSGGRGGGKFLELDGKTVIEKFSGDGGGEHLGNFLDAIIKGDDKMLRAPMHISAKSAVLSHLATSAYRAGTHRAGDEAKEMLKGNSAANELYERFVENLKVNGWDEKKEPLTVGGWLDWNDKQQKFTGGIGADAANALVTRPYRTPYVVPTLA